MKNKNCPTALPSVDSGPPDPIFPVSVFFLISCPSPSGLAFLSALDVTNEALIPLHPVVPNPYILLGTSRFTTLDLKDAFCIPLDPQSQFLFAFEWDSPTGVHQQLTWTVIPKGCRDRPHLFVKALARDIEDYSVTDGGSRGTILQCRPCILPHLEPGNTTYYSDPKFPHYTRLQDFQNQGTIS